MVEHRRSVFLAAAALITLTSCTSAATVPSEFHHAQVERDKLPASITDVAHVAPDSTRYIAPWQSTSVYVARSTQRTGSTCVVVLRQTDPSEWASSCNWSGGAVNLTFAGHEFRVGEGPQVSSDQRPTQLTEGVYAVS